MNGGHKKPTTVESTKWFQLLSPQSSWLVTRVNWGEGCQEFQVLGIHNLCKVGSEGSSPGQQCLMHGRDLRVGLDWFQQDDLYIFQKVQPNLLQIGEWINELYLRENEFCKKWPHSPTSRLKVIWHRYNSPKWSQMYQIHQPFLRTSFMISYPHPVWGIPFNNSWLMVEKTYLVWCFLIMSWPYIGEYTVFRSISAPFLQNIQHLEKLQKQITIAVTAKTLSFRVSQPESHFRHGEEGAKADGASHGRFTTMTVRESVWQRKGSAFHNSSAIVSWDQTHYFCNPLNVPRRKMWCVNLSDPRICPQDFHDFWLPLILNFSEASHVPYSMRPAPFAKFATLVGAWTKAGSCQVLALSKKGNTAIVQIAWSWVCYIF